jgi:hypothetical protein
MILVIEVSRKNTIERGDPRCHVLFGSLLFFSTQGAPLLIPPRLKASPTGSCDRTGTNADRPATDPRGIGYEDQTGGRRTRYHDACIAVGVSLGRWAAGEQLSRDRPTRREAQWPLGDTALRMAVPLRRHHPQFEGHWVLVQ